MQMLNLLFVCLFSIFFTSCGTDYESDSSSPQNNIDVTLVGIVVDGYISGATVCIDNNLNGECGIDEPTTITNSTGAFSFGTNNINNGAVVSYVASGGTDIATGKYFEGKLRQISEVYTSDYVYLTPLTDLIAKTFFASPIKDLNSLRAAKQTISRAYSVHSDYVDQSPATYAGVFARTQEIQQLIGLLKVAFIEAKGTVFTSSQKIELQENIKGSIVEDIDSSVEPNILNIISILEEDENLTIEDNVKIFVNEQLAYIKVDIEDFAKNQNLSLDNLNKYQNALEDEADKAYALLDGSSGEALKSFELNIDIFKEEDNTTVVVDDNTTVVEDDNTTVVVDDNITVVTDINVTFDGVVVAYGYIGDGVVCLDLDYSGACTSDESSVTTTVHGKFTFSDIQLQIDTFFPIISSGGIDDYSSRLYNGELKNIAVSNDLATNDIVISTLTDLMSLHFLNNEVKNRTTLSDSQTTFAQKMGITVIELLSDVAKDKGLYIKTVYLEHVKRLINLVVGQVNSRDTIKQAILAQILDGGYDELSISRILDYVEINLDIAISSEDRLFVQNTLADIKVILDEVKDSSDVQTYTLPTFQKILEDKLEESYITKNYIPLVMSVDEVIASEYDKDGAAYDVWSCGLNSINDNVLIDSNTTVGRESDLTNGFTVEANIEQVSLFYQTLDLDKSLNNIVVYDNQDRFSFSFNEVWIEKNIDIYIQTSKNEDGFFTCYKVKLNSNLAANIEMQKVFKYSYY